MKIVISVMLIFLVFPGFSQKDSLQTKILSPAEMKEDLEVYTNLLTETHPGLFRYQTEEEFNLAVQSIERKTEEPLPFYTFFRLIAGLSADIRCAHTQVFPNRDVLSYLKNYCKVFPLFLYPIEDRSYVLFNGSEDSSLKPGYEIISINGKPVKEIRDIIFRYHFRDGNTEEVMRRFMQGGMFSLYYYLLVDRPSHFDLIVKNLSGQEQSITIPAMSYVSAERNYISKEENKEMVGFYTKKNKNWDYKILDDVPSTAYLLISSFGSKGVNTEEEAQVAFQKFMDKSLRKIEKKKVENLIIELRGNSGGWDIQGKELFSYLMKTDTAVLYYEGQIAATDDSGFLKYSDISPEEIKQARKYLIPLDDGTFKVDPAGNKVLLPQEPKENRFRGKVYILVDEKCASTCAEFVAAAKSNKLGVLVGNESGGAYEGGNGSTFITYSLPNSKIYSNTPLVKYTMEVDPVQPEGKGTIPDHRVMFSLEDILTGTDAQKEFVFDLIQSDME